jgi:(4-(4-[2-(gamma-L-glutamylamino)ethyl]phenoxymethyl)furan-2-yl)methanamine synthase
MTRVIGWDVGGANVKLAVVEAGRVETVAQIPCPLIADRAKFDQAVAAALPLIGVPAVHAVTMTGELSDVFEAREDGVGYLVDLMVKMAAPVPVLIYAGAVGFLTPPEAKRQTPKVASANWHASAALAAKRHGNALLADVGTTTTDLIPVKGGKVAALGATDAERLASGELVYGGVVRTPVMAITQTAPFRGRSQRIAAERFATMADVYRLTGDLPEDADPYPAADQRDKSCEGSARRLARMLGRDAAEAAHADWVALACHFADCQLALIDEAAREVVLQQELPDTAPVIGAGCGRFLVRQLAARLGRAYVDFADLIDGAPEAREAAARSAPAVAVALLAPPC